MARPKLRGVLLCEDTEHERFFRRLLKKWFGTGKLHVSRIPNRQGAGDAWVLANYVNEVRIARRKAAENYALVVVIDGDRAKMKERMRQLDHQLTDAELAERGLEERVAVFVPTRNIETWELWLCGEHNIDEDGDYKRQLREATRRDEASVISAVDAWFRNLSPQEIATEKKIVPSLAAGRTELQRIAVHGN